MRNFKAYSVSIHSRNFYSCNLHVLRIYQTKQNKRKKPKNISMQIRIYKRGKWGKAPERLAKGDTVKNEFQKRKKNLKKKQREEIKGRWITWKNSDWNILRKGEHFSMTGPGLALRFTQVTYMSSHLVAQLWSDSIAFERVWSILVRFGCFQLFLVVRLFLVTFGQISSFNNFWSAVFIWFFLVTCGQIESCENAIR